MRTLGPGQKPIVQTHYRHFLAEDTFVWTKFLEKNAHRITECWYDLRVGTAIQLGLGASDLAKRVAAGLTRKRIDVVCSVDDAIWVVEVKPHANMYAVGQIVSYVRMFEKEFAVSGEVVPVIVCDSYDEDLVDEFEEFGILVIEND